VFELPEVVDPGEAILAMVGICPLLTETSRIPADDWREIGEIVKRCNILARQLVNGEVEANATPAMNYDGLLDALSEPFDPNKLDPIISEIPVSLHDAISAFSGAATRALGYLETKFPISVVRGLCSNVNVPPSDFSIGMFEDLLEVVDKPLSVYGIVKAGRLTSDQALALKTCYPTLYTAIVTSIVQRINRAVAEDKNWDCEFERGWSVLLSVPGLDPSIKKALAIPPDNQPQTNQAAQSRPPDKSPATNTATASQKVDNALQTG
jgi:hypothetical protein